MMATTAKSIRVDIETAAGLKPEGKMTEFSNECEMLAHVKKTWPKCQYVIYYPDKNDERYYGDIAVKVFHPHKWQMVSGYRMSRFVNIMTGYDFDQVGTHMMFTMTPYSRNGEPVTVSPTQLKELKESGFDADSFSPNCFTVRVCDND